MTDFDKTLIKKANGFSHWDYRKIDVLITLADTVEARRELANLRCEFYDLVKSTL